MKKKPLPMDGVHGQELIELSEKIWKVSKKLLSLGALLQGEEGHESKVRDLEGLGWILEELGNELGDAAIDLDQRIEDKKAKKKGSST